MTDLRTAAQQALEALGLWATGRDMDAVALNDLILRLEAALENQFNPDWDRTEALQESLREHMAEIHRLRAALAEPVQEPVALKRAKVEPIRVRIMQEAYDLADRDDSEGYNSVKVMCSEVLNLIDALIQSELTTSAPPQRKPLTEEEIDRIDQSIPRHTELKTAKRLFARAIERAHNIGEEK